MRALAAVAAAAAAAVLAASCGPAIPPLPSKGGPAWLELTSEHFTLWTDAGRARGVELIGEMEQLRQVVLGVAFRGAPATGRGVAIAFANDAELHAYVPDMFGALTIHAESTPLHEPLILLSASSNTLDLRRVETHELVHLISEGVIRRQPAWFAEGLARYFETIELDVHRGTTDVGRAPSERGAVRVQPHLESLDTLMACTAMTCMTVHFYATAWALFTYLMNVRPADLARLEQRLIETDGDGTRAWTDVFGADSRAAIDGDMRRWLLNGSHTVQHYNIQLADHPVTTRALTDADVLALRVLVSGHMRASKTAVAAQLDAALALDPTNVLARVDELYLGRKLDATAAHALAAAHPADWHSWWLLATAAPPGSDDARDARAKACALIAADPAIVSPLQLCVAAAPAPPSPPAPAPPAPAPAPFAPAPPAPAPPAPTPPAPTTPPAPIAPST